MPPKTVKSGWPLTTPNAVRIRSLDRLWPGRHRRRQRWGCGHRGADAGPVWRRHASPRHQTVAAACGSRLDRHLVAIAGRTDGRILDAGTVELALLEASANGNALDAGQAALVRAMCTSGARLQLAIAPAGAGKPPLCAPWLGRGATAAATWSGWPRRPPQRRNSAMPTVHRPTCWPSSPGPSSTVACPIGRNASTGQRW
jgi:hypothetical protein